jgi:hypothetical protein
MEEVEIRTIYAEEGKVFRRIHDGMVFGNRIDLGFDFSTGEKREDKGEYYEQIDAPQIDSEIDINL